MSLNTAHANNGVLIYAGEGILLFCDHVTIEFSGQKGPEFHGSKDGRIYLTTHRMIFNNKKMNDKLASFSFPFCTLSDVELEQPMFGANYLKGKVRAQPNGGWIGEVKFKLYFKHGGAIEYGQAMLQASALVKRRSPFPDVPPAYQAPPPNQWQQAPPPAYYPQSGGYYGWAPPTNVFPDAPPASSVYMTDLPPPYPGLNTAPGAYNAPPYPGLNSAPGAYNAPPYPGLNPAPGAYNAPFYDPNGKAAEAAASATAYYDPNRPNYAYIPPPAYGEAPPMYDDTKKKLN